MELAKEFDNNIAQKYNSSIPHHSIIFNSFIRFINRYNINYVIIRGFQKLPSLPDTDLDIMIDRGDFSKVTDMLKNSRYFEHRAPKHMKIKDINCTYHPFFTKGQKDSSIPNGCFRLDLHNAFCFFYKKKVTVPTIIEKEIYDTKIRYKQLYYIPNHQWEFILLLYRITYDLGGMIRDKHINRLKFLQEQLVFNYNVIDICLEKIKRCNIETYNMLSAFIKANLPKIDNYENHAFIFWTSKAINDFIKLIKDTHLEIVENININIDDKKERHAKINEIYEINIPEDHLKVLLNDPIRIYIIRDTRPIYEINTTSGLKITKVVNKNIFALKTKLRANYRPIDIHATDEINEANKIFITFNLDNFINKCTYIPIRYLRGVIWKTLPPNRSYELRKIGNTPHYRYILDINKDEYKRYINNIDILHSDSNKFKILMDNFDPLRCFSKDKDKITTILLENGYYLIYDGLHRVSLLKYFGYSILKVNVIDPITAGKSVYGNIKYDSIE